MGDEVSAKFHRLCPRPHGRHVHLHARRGWEGSSNKKDDSFFVKACCQIQKTILIFYDESKYYVCYEKGYSSMFTYNMCKAQSICANYK